MIRIDFVSDIACPWCAVGLWSLEAALREAGPAVRVDLRFQPFELNPDMPREGANRLDYFMAKYGLDRDAALARWEMIRARAADVGFAMRMDGTTRAVNTFDAHRLVHWAAGQDAALPVKRALLVAYFSEGRDVSDPGVLADVAAGAGLDRAAAGAMLASGAGADEVRAAESLWLSRGVHSVPTLVFDERHAVSGAHPPATFARALRELAAAA